MVLTPSAGRCSSTMPSLATLLSHYQDAGCQPGLPRRPPLSPMLLLLLASVCAWACQHLAPTLHASTAKVPAARMRPHA
eukprot:3177831-Amphidinium_carterae.2